MNNRIRSITLLAVFSFVLLSESSFAFAALPVAPQPTYSSHRHNVVYRRTRYTRRSRSGSKLKTALRIAAPAALGAGIGVLAGGKKGAAVGALIGGGSGAVYHLYKSRRRY